VGKYGATALVCASRYGHALAVKALLEGGADVGQVDKVRKRVDDGRVLWGGAVDSHPRPLFVKAWLDGTYACC
jgi:hypothetical protein